MPSDPTKQPEMLQQHQILQMQKEHQKLSGLVGKMCNELSKHNRTLAVYLERQNTQKEVNQLFKDQIYKLDERVDDVEKVQAATKPFVDLVKSINNKLIMLILGVFTSALTAGVVALLKFGS